MTRKRQRLTISTLLPMAAILVAQSSLAASLADRCEARKLVDSGRNALCRIKAAARAAEIGGVVEVASCSSKMTERFSRAERVYGNACVVRGDAGTIDRTVADQVKSLTALLQPPSLDEAAFDCAYSKLLETGRAMRCRLSTRAKALRREELADFAKCDERLAQKFVGIENRFGLACSPSGGVVGVLDYVARFTVGFRMNVILVYLDDTRWDVLDQLPASMAPNLNRLASEGVMFTNAFAPTPICAPSRASMLTGLRIRDGVSGGHGVRTLNDIQEFKDQQTLATWFSLEGRPTGLFGKYINGYSPDLFDKGHGMYVPPGWTEWRAIQSPEYYGGLIGATWYTIENDGARTEHRGCCSWNGDQRPPKCHANDPACIEDQTYQTDILADQLVDYFSSKTTPGWLAIMTPSASHGGHAIFPDPAARHANMLMGIPLWRPPSLGRLIENGFDGLWKARALPVPFQPDSTDAQRRRGLESLLSVDEALGRIFQVLEAKGTLSETAIILSSDNGATWGEHGIWNQGKACPYEECQRVPLIVRMPSGTARVIDEPVLVFDLAPTIAALARVPVAVPTDGRSFVPLLVGETPEPAWRGEYCMEYEPVDVNEPGYHGMRDVMGGWSYIEYTDGRRELFDLRTDPGQLTNLAELSFYATKRTELAARLPGVCR